MSDMNEMAHRVAAQARRGTLHLLHVVGASAVLVVEVHGEYRFVHLRPAGYKREAGYDDVDDAKQRAERELGGGAP